MVHTLNVVQLSRACPDDRRERTRDKKRRRYLDAAGRIIDRDGLGGRHDAGRGRRARLRHRHDLHVLPVEGGAAGGAAAAGGRHAAGVLPHRPPRVGRVPRDRGGRRRPGPPGAAAGLRRRSSSPRRSCSPTSSTCSGCCCPSRSRADEADETRRALPVLQRLFDEPRRAARRRGRGRRAARPAIRPSGSCGGSPRSTACCWSTTWPPSTATCSGPSTWPGRSPRTCWWGGAPTGPTSRSPAPTSSGWPPSARWPRRPSLTAAGRDRLASPG